MKKTECVMCGNSWKDTLGDIEDLEIMVFNKIPIRQIVHEWYIRGYKPEDVVCSECLIK